MPITFSQGLGVAAIIVLFAAAEFIKSRGKGNPYPGLYLLLFWFFALKQADVHPHYRDYGLALFLIFAGIREVVHEVDRSNEKH